MQQNDRTLADGTGATTGATDIYFRDETQIFFMDSQIDALSGKDKSQWTSHVSRERAAPLRMVRAPPRSMEYPPTRWT